MVSTRRTQPSPSSPNLAVARAVPDDPPPPPPTVTRTAAVQKQNRKPSDQSGTQSRNENASVGERSLLVNGSSNLETNDRGGELLRQKDAHDFSSESVRGAENEPMPQVGDSDHIDSDAPDEEPSSASKSLARVQMEKERIARLAIKKERSARRRGRAESRALGTQSKLESGGHENGRHQFLSEDVLREVEGAMGVQKKDEATRRQEDKLRKQKGKRERREEVRLLMGSRVAVAVQNKKKMVNTASGRRQSAVAFLEASMYNVGMQRVSSAKATRISQKAKLMAS